MTPQNQLENFPFFYFFLAKKSSKKIQSFLQKKHNMNPRNQIKSNPENPAKFKEKKKKIKKSVFIRHL